MEILLTAMPKLLVCQHVPYEILGTFHPLIKASKCRIKYVNFGRHPEIVPSVKGYDGLVILGGPISAYDDVTYPHILTEVKLIRDAIKKDIPILGICLGSQLIARALGAKTYKNPDSEIGWYDVAPSEEGLKDPLLGHFGKTRKIFQWHGDTFELPEDCVSLASSKLCTNQAFRYKDKVYGFQFHLEVDEPLIERWLTVPAHQAELASLEGVIDPAQVRTDTHNYIKETMILSDQVFSSFIKFLERR